MKYLIFLLIILSSCSQKNEKDKQFGKLNISFDYCKYSNEHPFLKEVKIFNKKELFKTVDLKKGKDELELPIGIYNLKYKSIYNIINNVEVTIVNKREQNVILCIDKINYENNNNVISIDELNNNEILEYYFQSSGCFHSNEDKLIIAKNKSGELNVKYKDTVFTVSKEQHQLIREYEIELRCNHSSGCSTIDTYGVYNKQSYELYTVKDESCEWRGFNNLLKKLELN